MFSKRVTRRNFLRGLGIGAGVPIIGGLVAACSNTTAQQPTADAMDHSNDASHNTGMTNDQMDAMHEAGVKAFLAGVDTGPHANQPLEPTIDNGVKVFNLTASEFDWRVTGTITVKAWGYNGTMPGPVLRVTEGDKVRIVLKNELPESTALHLHGLVLPNAMDGTPFITQPPIKPGQTFTYEFTARNPGSHMYHSHHDSTKQVGKGLLGAFIIEPKDRSQDPAYDIDEIMILNDVNGGFTINGKGFPATRMLKAKAGQKIRLRYMNEGQMIHPMHLHGMPQEVFSKDGWNQPPWKCDTLNVAPGERWDVIIDCTEPGAWAFHCHILTHAENEHGMFGMVTALVVEA